MSRLIDADALIAKQASIAKTFAHSDAQKSLMGRVIYNIEKAPTIKAIPVGWIHKFCEDDISEDQQMAIEWMLGVWQREQEAQDG